MTITNLNFREIVDKKDPHEILSETLSVSNRKAYLCEAIEYSDGSYAPVAIFDSNSSQLTEGVQYTLNSAGAYITFQDSYSPTVGPYTARYTGVGSIIWSHDVTEIQDAVTTINLKALNKQGDTLEGVLNVDGYDISNVSTINNIHLWTHDHSSGNGNQIPTAGIENDAVTTEKISDLNITTEKLSSKLNNGTAAVGTDNIKNGAVTTSEIASNAVENDKIKTDTISFNKLNKISFLNALYPVGAVYITFNSSETCPLATILGGTWIKVTDMFLVGAGNLYSLGGEGGEKEHTLIINEMPNHTHTLTVKNYNESGHYIIDENRVGSPGSEYESTVTWTTNNSGGGQAHNNMPPYKAVNIWRRTA